MNNAVRILMYLGLSMILPAVAVEKEPDIEREKPSPGAGIHDIDHGAVIFRHGKGTPYETVFHIITDDDPAGSGGRESYQMAYTLYAKGQPIQICFGDGHDPVFNRPWLRNRVSIDHKLDVSGRNTSNPPVAFFLPEIEYMRAARDIDRIRPIVAEYPEPAGKGTAWSEAELDAWRRPRPDEDISKTGWHRQVFFLKDADPRGPNYFILRDAFGGAPARPTDLSLWFLANTMQRNGNMFHYDGQFEVDMDVFVCTPRTFEPETGRYGPPQWARERYADLDAGRFPGGKLPESQLFLRVKQPPAEGYMVVLYPRLKRDDPPAVFTRLADSVVKIETAASTDVVFASPDPFEYEDDELRFHGTAAAVRFNKKSDKIVAVNCEGKVEIAVAGKTVTGEGAFALRMKKGKVVSVMLLKGAKYDVQ